MRRIAALGVVLTAVLFASSATFLGNETRAVAGRAAPTQRDIDEAVGFREAFKLGFSAASASGMAPAQTSNVIIAASSALAARTRRSTAAMRRRTT